MSQSIKPTIETLREHMFDALDMLRDKNLSGDKLTDAIRRASAIKDVGNVIVQSAKVEVDFMDRSGMPGSGFIPDDARPHMLQKQK